MISVYMIKAGKPFLMALLPGMFYMFIISAFILNAQIGFNMSYTASCITAAALTVFYCAAVIFCGRKKLKDNTL